MPRFVRSILSVSGVNAVNGILGLLVVPIGLRCVGVEGYGLFAIYGVIASYVALSDLGVTKNLLRTLAAAKSDAERVLHLRTALAVYLGLAIALLALAPLVALLIPRLLFTIPAASARAAGWIGAMAIFEYVLGIPVSMMQAACVSREKFDRFARFNLASGIVRYTLLLGAFLAFRSPVAAAISQAARRPIDIALAALIMGTLPKGSWSPRLGSVRAMVADSSILSLAQILYLSAIQSPALLVNWTFGLHALGIYRAVYDLAAKVFFFGNVMGLVLFPKFAKTSKGDSFSRSLPRVMRASWSFYGSVACAAAIATPLILPVLGLKETAALEIFPMICLGLCLNAHGILSTEAMQAGRLWLQMIAISLVSLTLLATVFYAGRDTLGFSAIGAAWIAAQGIFVLLADHLVLKERTGESRSIAIKAALLALCAAASWPNLMSAPARLIIFVLLLAAFLFAATPLLRQSQLSTAGRD